MTFDKEINRLGLTEKKMKEYNIKILLVSATPDVNLSIFSREDNHRLVILNNGPGYKGFDYYDKNEMIKDYDKKVDIETLIKQNYTSPRYHFIRARVQQQKGEYRQKIKNMSDSNGWIFKEDDSNNNFYISHIKDDNEKIARDNDKKIITTYEKPSVHTLILIKNKYQASKRLKLTKYVGIVSEKPANKRDTSVTCNGLIPRFFGYEPLPDFDNDEKSLFYCNKKCITEYISFCKDFVYNGKDYTSRRINSSKKILLEKSSTAYANLNNSENQKTNNNNNIDVKEYLLKDDYKKFFKDVLGKEIPKSFKETGGYIISTRLNSYYNKNKEHLTADDRLTKKKYNEISKNTNISSTEKGQNYMVYYVYDDENSKPGTEKYYVHYLKQ